jgi:hypothetical protein
MKLAIDSSLPPSGCVASAKTYGCLGSSPVTAGDDRTAAAAMGPMRRSCPTQCLRQQNICFGPVSSPQFPTMADARMAYKAPIEPKDVDAIVDYLISIRGSN